MYKIGLPVLEDVTARRIRRQQPSDRAGVPGAHRRDPLGEGSHWNVRAASGRGERWGHQVSTCILAVADAYSFESREVTGSVAFKKKEKKLLAAFWSPHDVYYILWIVISIRVYIRSWMMSYNKKCNYDSVCNFKKC